MNELVEIWDDKRYNTKFDRIIVEKYKEGHTAYWIWKAITKTYGEKAISKPTVKNRVRRIEQGEIF